MSTRTPIATSPVRAEPASDVLRVARHPLDPFSAPSPVAMVGATEKVGSVGRTLLPNPHREPIWRNGLPVNPKGRIARTSMCSIGVTCCWFGSR